MTTIQPTFDQLRELKLTGFYEEFRSNEQQRLPQMMPSTKPVRRRTLVGYTHIVTSKSGLKKILKSSQKRKDQKI